MDTIYEITKCDYGFPYSQLVKWLTKDEISKYCNSFRQQCSKITKFWDNKTNAEWLMRHYFAVKMILSASIMISSADYSRTKNIRITQPYLYYYSILSCCRALIFTLPRLNWNGGQLFEISHKKILNYTADTVGVLSKKRGTEIKLFLDYARSMRELFSYKFPASGLGVLKKSENYEINYIINVCSLICEIAQLQSELMQASIGKNAGKDIELKESDLKCCFEYDIDRKSYTDQEDWYRINYMTRKMKRPVNLKWMMTSGLVEDFFCAWIPNDDDDEDVYNPDEYWSMIFPALGIG